MSKLSDVIEKFLTASESQATQKEIDKLYSKRKKKLEIKFESEFMEMYQAEVGDHEQAILSTLIGFVQKREDGEIWAPYVTQLWGDEQAFAIGRYLDRAGNCGKGDLEGKRHAFDWAIDGLVELVVLAGRMDASGAARRLVEILDRRYGVRDRQRRLGERRI